MFLQFKCSLNRSLNTLFHVKDYTWVFAHLINDQICNDFNLIVNVLIASAVFSQHCIQSHPTFRQQDNPVNPNSKTFSYLPLMGLNHADIFGLLLPAEPTSARARTWCRGWVRGLMSEYLHSWSEHFAFLGFLFFHNLPNWWPFLRFISCQSRSGLWSRKKRSVCFWIAAWKMENIELYGNEGTQWNNSAEGLLIIIMCCWTKMRIHDSVPSLTLWHFASV